MSFVLNAAALRMSGADPRPHAAFACAIDSVPDTDWDRIVREFDDTTHDQTSFFSGGYWNSQKSWILLSDRGAPVAGARLVILTLPGFKAGLAFLKYGPFWRRDGASDMAIYRSAVGAIVDEYCVRRGHCLTVMPRPNPQFYPLECKVLEDMGFAIRREIPGPNRYLVDLSLDADAQMSSLDQKWRYNLRQALANNIDVRFCESEADHETFRVMYESMVERKNFSSPPDASLLGARGADVALHLRPRLVMGFHEGIPVIGATVSTFGDTAYYAFGASRPEALALKAGYALQWWIVRWLSEQKSARWYDLGGEGTDQGLHQFKKGLVGKRGAIVIMNGEYDRWTHLPGRLAADVIFGVRAARHHISHWLGLALLLGSAAAEKPMPLVALAEGRLPLLLSAI
jgi:hypothetical protein